MRYLKLGFVIFFLLCIANSSYQSSCYLFDKRSSTWKLFAKMNSQRHFAQSAVLDNSVWINGGFNGKEILKSTEFINQDETVRSGVDLPFPREVCWMIYIINHIVCLSGCALLPWPYLWTDFETKGTYGLPMTQG